MAPRSTAFRSKLLLFALRALSILRFIRSSLDTASHLNATSYLGGVAVLVSASFLASGCKKDPPQASPESKSSASKSQQKTTPVDTEKAATNKTAELPKGLKFVELGELPGESDTAISGQSLIACTGCTYPSGQLAIYQIDRSGAQYLQERSLGLIAALDAVYGKGFANFKKRFPDSGSLAPRNSRDGEIRMVFSAHYDDDDISRNGSDWMSDDFLFREGKWGKVPQVLPSSAETFDKFATAVPRRYDDALSRLPIQAEQFSLGKAGPLIAFGAKDYAVLHGEEWQVHGSLPRNLRGVLRLSDGSTLLSGDLSYRIDAYGELERIRPVPKEELDQTHWRLVHGEPWLVGKIGNKTKIFAPSIKIGVQTPPPREFFGGKTSSENKDATAHSSGLGGADPKPQDLGTETIKTGPSPMTESCDTPFVLLSTPPRIGWHYGATATALKGLDSKGLRFFEVMHGGKVYFGAQAESRAAASQLETHFRSAIKGSQPQQYCWQLASALPDRYSPPSGLRELLFNFVLGREFIFLK